MASGLLPLCGKKKKDRNKMDAGKRGDEERGGGRELGKVRSMQEENSI